MNKKVKCSFCNGTGEVSRVTFEVDDDQACPCCGGTKLVNKEVLKNFLEKEVLANMEEEE